MARSTQDPPIEVVVTSHTLGTSRQRDVFATLTSACIHALLLLILALWVFPALTADGKKILQIAFSGDESYALESVQLSADTELPIDAKPETQADVPDIFEPPEDEFSFNDPKPMVASPAATTSVQSVTFSVDTLSSSATVADAVDRITGELKSKLENSDLLVVWLLDASNSLVDDRQRVAARLTPFYESLAQRESSSGHVLLSAVVSYGSRMRERVAPTEFGKQIVAAVEKLPVDRTGNEKVFDAVARCAQHYRESWDKQCVIVIWTDESGDDVTALADTIAVCQQQQVSVSVVGPSSVLGADTGLHSYTDPKTKNIYQLPVRRGPETAKPERLELGYWYLTRARGGRRRAGLPSWLGGQDLEGILSGFSPYALTRLTTQTGGSYTIFDRPEDRGPFDPITMKQYAPSYGSLDEYEADIQSHPIRRAVTKANGELRGKKIDAPPTMLFIKKTGDRVFDFMRYFYSPHEFQAKLRSSRGRLKAQATRSSKFVDEALRHLSTDATLEVGFEDEYRDEESIRWRAWYDLTRGRLLATSVRLEEYRLTIDEIAKPNALASTTNHVMLFENQRTRSSEKFQKRAEEAERLLRRCVYENQGTPWEILAQRELDYAVGVGVREMALTPNPSGPETRQPNLPRF